MGIIHNTGTETKTYVFRKNIQGDVTHIIDIDNSVVACYNYDAWGNHTVTSPNGNIIVDPSHIAMINPIRYKGYYFDAETNLYYLQSRYYDSETGRFISPDDVSFLDPNTIGGMNLYAYCLNNPVMNYDPSGHFVISMGLAMLLGFVVGGLISAGASAITQGITYGWDNINLGQVLADGLIGGISGLISMSGIGIIGQVAWGGFWGMVSYVTDCGFRDKTPTWSGVLLATGLGGFFGGLGGNGVFKDFGKKISGKLFIVGMSAKTITITMTKSLGISSGVNIGIAGINKFFDFLTDGQWSNYTGLNAWR